MESRRGDHVGGGKVFEGLVLGGVAAGDAAVDPDTEDGFPPQRAGWEKGGRSWQRPAQPSCFSSWANETVAKLVPMSTMSRRPAGSLFHEILPALSIGETSTVKSSSTARLV